MSYKMRGLYPGRNKCRYKSLSRMGQLAASCFVSSILVLLVPVSGLVGDTYEPTTQLLLITKVLGEGYDKSLRPVKSGDMPITVWINMEIREILSVDEIDNSVRLVGWMQTYWYDSRLTWNRTQMSNLSEVLFTRDSIWNPDIILYNGDVLLETLQIPTYVRVRSDGRVVSLYKAELRGSCELDITFFPFDYQECTLSFGSWVYDARRMEIVNTSGALDSCGDMHSFKKHEEWDLIAYFALLHKHMQKTEVVQEDGERCLAFKEVMYHMLLKRRPMYYVVIAGVPSILVMLLTVMGMFTPTDTTGERSQKIQMGLTALMNMTLLLSLVANTMPATSKVIPVISIYYCIGMFLIVVTATITTCLLELQRQANTMQTPPMWLSALVEHIAPLVFVGKSHSRFTEKKFRAVNPTVQAGGVGVRSAPGSEESLRDQRQQNGAGTKDKEISPSDKERYVTPRRDRRYSDIENKEILNECPDKNEEKLHLDSSASKFLSASPTTLILPQKPSVALRPGGLINRRQSSQQCPARENEPQQTFTNTKGTSSRLVEGLMSHTKRAKQAALQSCAELALELEEARLAGTTFREVRFEWQRLVDVLERLLMVSFVLLVICCGVAFTFTERFSDEKAMNSSRWRIYKSCRDDHKHVIESHNYRRSPYDIPELITPKLHIHLDPVIKDDQCTMDAGQTVHIHDTEPEQDEPHRTHTTVAMQHDPMSHHGHRRSVDNSPGSVSDNDGGNNSS